MMSWSKNVLQKHISNMFAVFISWIPKVRLNSLNRSIDDDTTGIILNSDISILFCMPQSRRVKQSSILDMMVRCNHLWLLWPPITYKLNNTPSSQSQMHCNSDCRASWIWKCDSNLHAQFWFAPKFLKL